MDPEAIDHGATAEQRRRIEAVGGVDAILAAGDRVPYTPAPDEFDPAPVEPRQRGTIGRR